MEYLIKSIKQSSKSRNGDCVFAGFIKNLSQKKLFLLAIADGVGGGFQDWKASSDTINILTKSVSDASPQLTMDVIIEHAINIANDYLILHSVENKKLLSTLSLVLIDIDNTIVCTANVGDSRIYALSSSGWNLLTEDDVTTVPYRQNGKILMKNGTPVMVKGLSRAIGSLHHPICIKSYSMDEFYSFMLCSDGYYSLPSFGYSLSLLSELKSLDEFESAYFNELSHEIQDDASISVVRLDTYQLDKNTLNNIKESMKFMPKFIILKKIEERIKSVLEDNYDEATMNELSDLLLNTKFSPTSALSLALLNAAIANENTYAKENFIRVMKCG